jgi:hypothetical protein
MGRLRQYDVQPLRETERLDPRGKRLVTLRRIERACCDAFPSCGMITKISTSESSRAESLAYEPKSMILSGLKFLSYALCKGFNLFEFNHYCV